MPEKFIEGGIETKPEKEKKPESIITAYVIRHGESITDKFDPRRGLTEKGREQVRKAFTKIAEEIMQETDPETEVELRGFDSGFERANQALIGAVQVLAEKGFGVKIPYSSKELAQDPSILEQMEQGGLIRILGKKGMKPESFVFLRPITFPTEAKKAILEEAKKKGEYETVTIFSTPPEELKKMGMETPEEAFARMESGVKRTNDLAQFMRQREKRPRRTFYIAISHGYVMEIYLSKKLGISPTKLGEIPNCEGFRIDFTGKTGEKPKIKVWGEETKKRMAELEKKE